MLRTVTAAILLLLMATLRAAEPEPATDTDTNADGAAADRAAIEAEDPALAEEIRAAEEEAASAAPRDANESFVPTVQISEDLSVSFPVDI